MKTQTKVVRETRETQIRLELSRGTGKASVDTGLKFFDHMLATLARYASLDLQLHARGDLRHHLIEDVAIAFGTALKELIPETAARYGDCLIPMDDALVQAAVDVGGRFYCRAPLPGRLYRHWFRSFAENARITLHVRILRGKDRHHVTEAAFKALGMALRRALEESGAVFSTKGSVRWEVT